MPRKSKKTFTTTNPGEWPLLSKEKSKCKEKETKSANEKKKNKREVKNVPTLHAQANHVKARSSNVAKNIKSTSLPSVQSSAASKPKVTLTKCTSASNGLVLTNQIVTSDKVSRVSEGKVSQSPDPKQADKVENTAVKPDKNISEPINSRMTLNKALSFQISLPPSCRQLLDESFPSNLPHFQNSDALTSQEGTNTSRPEEEQINLNLPIMNENIFNGNLELGSYLVMPPVASGSDLPVSIEPRVTNSSTATEISPCFPSELNFLTNEVSVPESLQLTVGENVKTSSLKTAENSTLQQSPVHDRDTPSNASNVDPFRSFHESCGTSAWYQRQDVSLIEEHVQAITNRSDPCLSSRQGPFNNAEQDLTSEEQPPQLPQQQQSSESLPLDPSPYVAANSQSRNRDAFTSFSLSSFLPLLNEDSVADLGRQRNSSLLTQPCAPRPSNKNSETIRPIMGWPSSQPNRWNEQRGAAQQDVVVSGFQSEDVASKIVASHLTNQKGNNQFQDHGLEMQQKTHAFTHSSPLHASLQRESLAFSEMSRTETPVLRSQVPHDSQWVSSTVGVIGQNTGQESRLREKINNLFIPQNQDCPRSLQTPQNLVQQESLPLQTNLSNMKKYELFSRPYVDSQRHSSPMQVHSSSLQRKESQDYNAPTNYLNAAPALPHHSQQGFLPSTQMGASPVRPKSAAVQAHFVPARTHSTQEHSHSAQERSTPMYWKFPRTPEQVQPFSTQLRSTQANPHSVQAGFAPAQANLSSVQANLVPSLANLTLSPANFVPVQTSFRPAEISLASAQADFTATQASPMSTQTHIKHSQAYSNSVQEYSTPIQAYSKSAQLSTFTLADYASARADYSSGETVSIPTCFHSSFTQAMPALSHCRPQESLSDSEVLGASASDVSGFGYNLLTSSANHSSMIHSNSLGLGTEISPQLQCNVTKQMANYKPEAWANDVPITAAASNASDTIPMNNESSLLQYHSLPVDNSIKNSSIQSVVNSVANFNIQSARNTQAKMLSLGLTPNRYADLLQ
ncbi:hypothetical protein FHG87_009426 [Trinorchestia longiramus]|nr:hypothetical protein FHG87_009426 [Trinorchestia longiramus]